MHQSATKFNPKVCGTSMRVIVPTAPLLEQGCFEDRLQAPTAWGQLYKMIQG